MKTEAAVIGAGPTGLLSAEVISKNGFNVEVFEEHNNIGYPVHCAGMVSVEGFKRLDILPNPSFHQNTIYGGKVFSSDGTCIAIKDTKPRAYIIDRSKFDYFLAERASSNGVSINTGKRVDRVNFKDGLAHSIMINKTEVSSEIIIDAEGAGGRLLGRSGIETGQKGILFGFNVDLDIGYIEPDMVEVWFDQSLAKGLFIWVIPLNESKVRCGLATSEDNGIKALNMFIRRRFNIEAPQVINTGLVCTGGPISNTVYPGMMLIGDVAGQVKPTTGGGLIIGGLCALLAGKVGAKSLSKGDLSVLGEYENEWRNKFGSELNTMLIGRRILNRLGDYRINQIFSSVKSEELEGKLTKLVEQGDMDMQSSVIKKALTDPAIIGSLTKSLGKLVLNEVLSMF
jgi:digeranylgeranylglycerophospholipid reductase